MKKALLYALCMILAAAVGAVSCFLILRSDEPAADPEPEPSLLPGETRVPVSEELTRLAFEVAAAVKNGDYEAMSKMVHPEFGVVFSPTATVNLASNKRFTAAEVAKFDSDTVNYIWGLTADGGVPINMTVKYYFKTYVFDYDYTSAPLVGVNYPVKSGGSPDNLSEAFPGAQFVDLCNPGASGGDGLDWSILRLVFEEYDGQLTLTGVIHSQYSI